MDTVVQPSNYESYPGGVCLISMDGKEQVLFCNELLASWFGYDSPEDFLSAIHHSYPNMVYSDGYTDLKTLYGNASSEGGAVPVYLLGRDREGKFLFLSGTLASRHDGDTPVWALYVVKDMKNDRPGQRRALSDFLRPHKFYKATVEAADRDYRMGVFSQFVPLFFNLTNFKIYNASHGREAGDALIEQMARSIRHEFPTALACHLGGDHFEVLAPREMLIPRLNRINESLNFYLKDSSIALKIGMVVRSEDEDNYIPVERYNLFDCAKVAADSIKNDATRFWMVYTASMGETKANQVYVLKNFEQALEREYFQVFYQPVIRTYTGNVCNLEALSRWEDPERGRIMPKDYIPVLEEAGLIPQLDYYVIDKVASYLAERVRLGQPVVPVSVNLSRVDFDQSNPFLEVEHIVSTYNIRRDWLIIEVTESALLHQNAKLESMLERFQSAGYICWIDDFGSAYSSLNTLQNYTFDTLKMDMAFMRNFTDKSRRIMKSIVLMAKMLGIHTLAEGAETQEQVDFLRAIGCERIQGYYYARPMPAEECNRWMEENKHQLEPPVEARLLQTLGLVNLLTDAPIALVLYDWKNHPRHLRVLVENEAFQNVRATAQMGTADEEENLHSMDKIRMAVKDALADCHRGSTTFVRNGQYMKYNITMLADSHGLYAGKAELYNLSQDTQLQVAEKTDMMFRNILSLHSDVAYYDTSSDKVEIIATDSPSLYQGNRVSFDCWLDSFAPVHPDDVENFRQMVRPDNVRQQALSRGHYVYSFFFRRRTINGQYQWQVLEALLLSSREDSDILYAVQDAPIEYTEERENFFGAFAHSFGFSLRREKREEPLVDSLLTILGQSTSLCCFLKDDQRRFRLVSQGFLRYYGISDEKLILGKTDEEIGWHPDNLPAASLENDVIQHETVYQDVETVCVVRGIPRRILVSKYPVQYANGKRGLLGFFKEIPQADSAEIPSVSVDLNTGLMTYAAMNKVAQSYFDQYRVYGMDFTAVLIRVSGYSRKKRQLASGTEDSLLRAISPVVQRHIPLDGIISYVEDGYFLFLCKMTETYLDGKMQDLEQDLQALTHIENIPVFLHMDYVMAHGQEAENLDGLYRLLKGRMKGPKDETKAKGEEARADGIYFTGEVLDSLSSSVIISDRDTREVLYVNKEGMRELGLSGPEEYRGRCCNELICGNTYRCQKCPYHELSFHAFHNEILHNSYLGNDYLCHGLLISYAGKICHLEILLNLSRLLARDRKSNLFVFRESAVNDMIEAGMREPDADKGIYNLLASIGRVLKADKVLIFEENRDGTADNTYEWCRRGVPSTIRQLERVPARKVRDLYAQYGSDQIAMLNAHKESLPREILRMEGIDFFLSGHLFNGSQSMGFTAVVNPSVSDREQARPILAILTRFVAIMIRNRDMMKELQEQSLLDPMTGAGNRRAFSRYLSHVPHGTPVAFFFGDLNGLKKINDSKGHEAGDAAIRTAVRILAGKVPLDHVFRMGGDEFLVAEEHISSQQMETWMAEYRNEFRAHGLSMALGATMRIAPCVDVDNLLTEVDREMYKDKEKSRDRR